MAKKDEIKNELNIRFKNEIKVAVSNKLDEINHYVSGVNSPFTYMQIANVQTYLCEIENVLGIKRGK